MDLLIAATILIAALLSFHLFDRSKMSIKLAQANSHIDFLRKNGLELINENKELRAEIEAANYEKQMFNDKNKILRSKTLNNSMTPEVILKQKNEIESLKKQLQKADILCQELKEKISSLELAPTNQSYSARSDRDNDEGADN